MLGKMIRVIPSNPWRPARVARGINYQMGMESICFEEDPPDFIEFAVGGMFDQFDRPATPLNSHALTRTVLRTGDIILFSEERDGPDHRRFILFGV